ncbi:SMI1/KNR4 family protein [Streptomyces parvus]|uniref:SMI1/KNR4 family protein n=1 Tax=Streptomyces parvus TaxID=66428 RepID=UPI003715C7C3
MKQHKISDIFELLGPPRVAHGHPPSDWYTLEQQLGIELPRDYKRFVSRYAPIQVNGHLYFNHPATSRWNLGDWMEATVNEFRRGDFSQADCPGFDDGAAFGGPNGLIPLIDSDSGDYLFGAWESKKEAWRFLACNGDEQNFYEYRMPFAEWIYRYLAGENMLGPNSGVFSPGPIMLESMPMNPEERSETWYGPERNSS